MKYQILGALTVLSGLMLTGCGRSSPVNSDAGTAGIPPAISPPDFPGVTNTVPATPAKGISRAGTCYNIYVQGGHDEKVAFTVCEPSTIEGGKTYPLVLHSHGFGDSRDTGPTDANGSPFTSGSAGLIAAGYGFISIDERGHGESGGTIRVMDPEYEGQDLLAVMDWAETHLDWLAYGPSADGSDPHNLIVGSIGGSYGGMFQYLIHNIDPRRRLDAMVPQAAPYDINDAVIPNDTMKLWLPLLFVAGEVGGGNGLDRGHMDPFVTNHIISDLLANSEDQDLHDFFRYHSNSYFCEGQPLATNGMGAAPEYAPRRGPKVHALLGQGMRDTLFNFNQGLRNYECLKAAGGDVRLLSYQSGHNSLNVEPDPGESLYHPSGDSTVSQCGHLSFDQATLAFFDEHLKGQTGAADSVPRKVCLSISGTDAVLVDQVTSGHDGTEVAVPSTLVTAGIPDLPMAVDLGMTAGADSLVVGGIPRLEVDVESVVPITPGVPVLFAGIGIQHQPPQPQYELVDNQIMPMRGVGEHDIDLAAVTARLKPGEKLVLLLYGGHDQYLTNGSVNLNLVTADVLPVTVSGKVWVPVLATPVPAP